MRLRHAALVVLGLLAIISVLWMRGDQDRTAHEAAILSVRNAEISPATLPEPDVAASDDSASDALPSPVDLDAADRDLDLFGRVVDAEGAPVPGATIECIHHPGRRTATLDTEDYDQAIVDAETRSAADGTFAFRLARGDLRELRVAHPGFAETCVAACQAGERVEIVLHPGARLELRTVDEAGAPVAEVQGQLRYRSQPSPSGERRFETDDGGRAELLSLAPGAVFVELEHPLLGNPGWQKLEFTAGETLVHEVVMPAGRTLVGTVIDRKTRLPIAGARVGEGWTMDREVLTDARGDYRLVGYSGKGVVDLHAEADGYGREQKRVQEGSDGLDFELEGGDVAVGEVVDAAGAPLPGIRVYAFGMFFDATVQKHEVRRATTGPDGRFRIDSLHPGLPHAIVIQARGFGRVRRDIDRSRRAPDGAIDLGTLALPPPRSLEGELVDAEGAPIPGTVVELVGDDAAWQLRDWLGSYGRGEERRTDDLGRFRFPDLAPGDYRLAVRLRGKPGIEKMVRIAESDPDPLFVRLALSGGESLQVQVLHPDGTPAEDTAVEANRGRTGARLRQRTDSAGIARFEGLRGKVHVKVHGPHGTLSADPIEIVPRGQTERFVLSPAAFVRGILVTPEGEPLGGMNLQCFFRRPDGVESSNAIHTEPDGTFELATHPGTVADIHSSGNRWEMLPDGERRGTWIPRVGSLVGVVAPAEGLRLVLPEIATNRTFDVRVVDPDGKPFEGINVFVSGWMGGGDFGPGRTDAEGRAHLEGLPATPVRVFCSFPKTPPAEGGDVWMTLVSEELVPAGQEVTLVFRPGRSFLGTVVDAEGVPIARGLAWGETPRGPIHQPFRDGFLELRLLEGETVTIEVEGEREGAFFTSGQIEIRGGEKERRIVLREE